MLVIIPPNRPAQVLFGLIFGANFTPPTSAPNMNAPISVATTEARIQKKYSNSLEAFKKATDINPKFWQAINNQALVYYELGFKKKAIKTWREVILLKSDPEPKLALAIALYALEPNSNEAIKLAKEALSQNPNYFFQQFQKEQLWGEKLQTAGIELFKNPKLKSVINTASANSNFSNEKDQ